MTVTREGIIDVGLIYLEWIEDYLNVNKRKKGLSLSHFHGEIKEKLINVDIYCLIVYAVQAILENYGSL